MTHNPNDAFYSLYCSRNFYKMGQLSLNIQGKYDVYAPIQYFVPLTFISSFKGLDFIICCIQIIYFVVTVNTHIPIVGINPIALKMAKTLWSFGHSECNRVKCNKIACLMPYDWYQPAQQHSLICMPSLFSKTTQVLLSQQPCKVIWKITSGEVQINWWIISVHFSCKKN